MMTKNYSVLLPTQVYQKHHPPDHPPHNDNTLNIGQGSTIEYFKHNPPDQIGTKQNEHRLTMTRKDVKHNPPDRMEKTECDPSSPERRGSFLLPCRPGLRRLCLRWLGLRWPRCISSLRLRRLRILLGPLSLRDSLISGQFRVFQRVTGIVSCEQMVDVQSLVGRYCEI